ncbi:ABC transporter permease [Xanthomonas oryzae]|uniref:ABC transporter permease n=1 Tax=Xanthomonas oryzae pv. oryzicola (strain BLS256) TaxID=383407 RepID=G7THL0_XANOB|nr:ABC transporter permease [Xanthomonas oryzae]AEQ97995.1 ABC transporter permease [Xanthomonas oryzae pv. oryzicola BLS256]AKO21098.1 ABC transporter ATP-binding protein [Xanthomonas oryzae pv. oryzicola]PUE97709.1 ABC transporter ATP-binding protein [Xanthomonas oryzae pv. oryzicola]WVN08338.1 ABC transporter permease [Xanthomonas oryzae pv. oryzicola]
MLGYCLKLAWHSLLRTPITSTLMVLAIGLGIGASMTMLTVLHAMSRDPLPGKSQVLYTPHLDPLPNEFARESEWANPSDNLTWPDAMALLRSSTAVHQAAMAGGGSVVWPVRAGSSAIKLEGRYTTADFFAMFGIPLHQGPAWSKQDDQNHARLIVLSRALAGTLFGTSNPIGQLIAQGEQRVGFRVVGVTDQWDPQPLFYADPGRKGAFGDQEDFVIPLSTAMELDLDTNNSISSWENSNSGGIKQLEQPSTSWLQFWVQLDTPRQVSSYERFLYDYAATQHAIGRFERPPETARLYALMAWLRHLRMVPDDLRLQTLLALGFLSICMVNVIALLLAKFLRRSGEIGMRRALDAHRSHVLLQFATEAALIGVLGGMLGAAITEVGLWSVRQRPDTYAALAHLDVSMLLTTVVLAIAAALLAGLLPAWRASRINPAMQIKEV